MEFLKLSWNQLARDCIALSGEIRTKKIDEIVSISRGGLVVSRILSDLLDVSISHISIISYQDLKQEKEAKIIQFLPETYKNETILLVDEVSDTGKTFKKALSYLQTLSIKKVYTIAPYIKSHTTYIPDFWKVRTEKWIIFPYELFETKKALAKMMPEKDVMKKLKEIGYKDWELKTVN